MRDEGSPGMNPSILQALVKFSGKNRFVLTYTESLLEDYKKTTAKLEREQERAKVKDSSIYEQDVEINNLKRLQDSQH